MGRKKEGRRAERDRLRSEKGEKKTAKVKEKWKKEDKHEV
jgi:hypothetical protein